MNWQLMKERLGRRLLKRLNMEKMQKQLSWQEIRLKRLLMISIRLKNMSKNSTKTELTSGLKIGIITISLDFVRTPLLPRYLKKVLDIL